MGTVEQNTYIWDKEYNWEQVGDEWSEPWGGTDMEWNFMIFPRIHSFFPVDTILEIAPGYGRWTQFLAKLCKKLIVVDLSQNCINACKKRFKEYSHISYFVNDGKSLTMVPDESIDFTFSFDSLVHAEEDVIKSYLGQLKKKMRHRGAGFIHHSNLGSCRPPSFFIKKIIDTKIYRFLLGARIIENTDHWRASSMTANKFKMYTEEAGLYCRSQEIINWRCKKLTDCLSIFTKEKTSNQNSCNIMINKNFMKEADLIKKLSELYVYKSHIFKNKIKNAPKDHC